MEHIEAIAEILKKYELNRISVGDVQMEKHIHVEKLAFTPQKTLTEADLKKIEEETLFHSGAL